MRGRWNSLGALVAASDDDRFEWTGHETEQLEMPAGTQWPELGLVYAGARWYDARLGQFLSVDPARQYASPFACGGWDPVNRTDPDGQFAGLAPLLQGPPRPWWSASSVRRSTRRGTRMCR